MTVETVEFLPTYVTRYFEEGGKPNSCWSTVFPILSKSMWTATVGFPPSSKYLLTDVNVCGAVQYVDMAVPELQLIECVL